MISSDALDRMQKYDEASSGTSALVRRKVVGFSFYDEAMLLPCPFCQSGSLEFDSHLADGWVKCAECECQGPHDHLAQVFLEKCEGNAIDLWNDREDA